jgi:hypothetical protein
MVIASIVITVFLFRISYDASLFSEAHTQFIEFNKCILLFCFTGALAMRERRRNQRMQFLHQRQKASDQRKRGASRATVTTHTRVQAPVASSEDKAIADRPTIVAPVASRRNIEPVAAQATPPVPTVSVPTPYTQSFVIPKSASANRNLKKAEVRPCVIDFRVSAESFSFLDIIIAQILVLLNLAYRHSGKQAHDYSLPAIESKEVILPHPYCLAGW